jgi:hypothetical protein
MAEHLIRILDVDTLAQEDREQIEQFGFTMRMVGAGTLDDGVQFVTVEQIDADGTVHAKEFMHPRAFEDAGSYINAAFEAATTSLEYRLGPHGLEWQREQAEREAGW